MPSLGLPGVVALALVAGPAVSGPAVSAPRIGGPWVAPGGRAQEPLWPGAAPNSPASAARPEHSETGTNPKRFAGLPVTGLYDVSVPTMTLFRPTAPANGAAVLVFPGGGFQQLAIDLEGSEPCDWLAARGFACLLVKYRVPGSNHHWDPGCRCARTPPHLTALQDAQRAIRLARARAGEWQIDPRRIGVMGFSAGGYLVAQTSNIVAPAYRPVDAIDRIDSRPDFAIALYPGHICRDGHFDPGLKVTRKAPPTFLLQAWDDPTDPVCNSIFYARALSDAGVAAEVHLFAKGGHAFALRPTGTPVDRWPILLDAWLASFSRRGG